MLIGGVCPGLVTLRTAAQTPTSPLSAAKSGAQVVIQAPVRTVPDPGVITTGQNIVPAGVQAVFEGRVLGVSFGGTSNFIYVLTAARAGAILYKLDWKANRAVEVVQLPVNGGMQGLTYDPVKQAPLITGTSLVRPKERAFREDVRILSVSDDRFTMLADRLGTQATGGLALSAGFQGHGREVGVVPLTFDDAAAVLDLGSGSVKWKVKTGIAPFGAVVNAAGTVAFVSNWGGRFPRQGDWVATTGALQGADKAVVDRRGIAASGTVSRVDLASGKVTDEIKVGLHPAGLAWDERRERLYVANGNSDSLSVIDTARRLVVATLELQPFERRVAGVAPESLALSADGRTLFAACGGINAVAVVNVTGTPRLEGLIPTAWYPDHLRLSPDGSYLVVSTLLGVGSGWKNVPVTGYEQRFGFPLEITPNRRFVHSYRGTVHVIPVPEADQLANYSLTVAEANHLRLRGSGDPSRPRGAAVVKPLPVPLRLGDPSLIQHIVYVIKENRSYDQMLGALGKGNGDPTLEVYGEDVTPNQRKLAREFVLLDNFYAAGGDSADGHQWATQAAETDYCYWHGYHGRSYPFEGSDPLAPAQGGFIWDVALDHHRTVMDFGEYVGTPIERMRFEDRVAALQQWKDGASFAGRFHTVAPLASLNKILASDYPYWTLTVPDVVRARIFGAHLRQWEKDGQMPNLVIVQLPCDHTAATDPGASTPKAMIADNDLALGQIVAALSQSRFWKSMAIFVVEDDAQSGLDHVDGHRTVALAISPYIRRGSIDSTFYSHPSMLKTIELMLGLPPLSLFDLIANDMRNSFQSAPNFAPYTAVIPKQSLFALNPPASALKGTARQDALASMKMNFRIPDAVPSEILNRVLWDDATGGALPYPRVRRGMFVPYSATVHELSKCGSGGDD